MTLPLAHHAAVAALPVFAPALIIVTVLTINYLRNRHHWNDEPQQGETPPPFCT